MKQPRRIDLYISDMIQSMERIALYLTGHSFDTFLKKQHPLEFQRIE